MSESLVALHKYFGFTEFRPGQQEVIKQVLAGQDVLAVMPTGLGKSLCYQLPALMMSGVTLVISPLVALMKDQVDSLHTRDLHQVTFLNSQLNSTEHRQRLYGIRQGEYKLIYIAPERLRSQSFSSLLPDISLAMLVVDEAHCISQWGHDFRPDYLYLQEFIDNIDVRPKVLALTATATLKVQQDILKRLGMEKAIKVITGSDRPNLYFSARRLENIDAKLQALAAIMDGEKGSGIIYTATRKDTEKVAEFLVSQLGLKAAAYHAGMSSQKRVAVQEAFIQGRCAVVVATNAFGMGIDKHNIRFVVHFSIPASVEAYYQEVGRAGRDGKKATCTLFYTPRDRALQEWMINNDVLTREHLVIFWKAYTKNLHDGRSTLNLFNLETAGLDENKLRLVVGVLERLGVIVLIERNTEYLEVASGSAAMNPQAAQAVLQESQRRQVERRNKLSFLVNWVHAGRCRREVLLNYFGEKFKTPAAVSDKGVVQDALSKSQYCCDNCTHTTAEKIMSLEPLEILRGAQQLQRGVGRKKLAAILQGSKAKDIIAQDYHLLSCYGKLKQIAVTNILAMVDRLLGDGYLVVVGEQYPVLELTPAGREAILLGKPLPLPIDMQIKTAEIQLDSALLIALKEYRSSLAVKNKRPPFHFFHDQVLKEIAGLKPVSLEKLALITGIGPKKLADYGRDLLTIIGYYSKDRK